MRIVISILYAPNSATILCGIDVGSRVDYISEDFTYKWKLNRFLGDKFLLTSVNLN